MFSRPEHGWVQVKLGDYESRAGYIYDIPNDILDSLIAYITECKKVVVPFDAEGWEFLFIPDYYSSLVVVEDENCEFKVYTIYRPIYEIAKEVINDIEENLTEWVKWMGSFEDSEEEDQQRLDDLKDKIEIAKNLYASGAKLNQVQIPSY